MRVFAKKTLREFWESHPDAEESLQTWYRRAIREEWTTPERIIALWPRASIVGGNRAVFRIKGNQYRLVVEVNYRWGAVYVRFVGTHAEYDRIDVEEV